MVVLRHDLDPVYTTPKESIFVTTPRCFASYTKEHESDTKLSQIENESETLKSGKVCGIFVSEKKAFKKNLILPPRAFFKSTVVSDT